MSKFLVAAVLLSLINHGADLATAWDDKDFFRYCPASKCSKHGPEIRFPFRLKSSNTSCSMTPCMELACSDQDTILVHPSLGRCKVTAIDYPNRHMYITPLVFYSSPCPLKKLFSRSIPIDAYAENQGPCPDIFLEQNMTLVCCPREFTPSSIDVADSIAGPVSCLSNATNFSYLVDSSGPISILPSDCKVCSDGVVPIAFNSDLRSMYDDGPPPFKSSAERILSFAEIKLEWREMDENIPCLYCEQQGRHCAFSSERNQTFCMPHGSRITVIAATSSVTAFVVLLLTVATALYLSLKTRYNEEIHLKVEMFLKTYGTSKPTRYTFSEVKKMARRFKEKVGQGGFGTVYKGELANGVPVAVKLLENSTGEGGEFINEVATIGRIHHANIVQLLGFCSEGTRRALIYEFMPNDSLEKYIFSTDSNIYRQLLVPEKMLDVSLGIARGMEYLHQGCNQRILHFDIKPHNILLDYNFNPKISDFGLAKLCARDQSIVTLTAARGTMGYIAPELYSRNFGGISYKSDVYSFGMLVLEMVSGRRNLDPSVGSQNEVYLPEWIYEKVITGQELELSLEMAQEEKEKVRQLAIVGLWCIQWNPKNRPSMTKVVNMLTGRLQNLQIPPKPFISSGNHPVV
ncbi:rust resistance kinase Lr10 [Aegilops tauschii subsp. strangulata]|nr:rust resistance kinase Lr10 [Aegilops tauschii subsp. strangulata]